MLELGLMVQCPTCLEVFPVSRLEAWYDMTARHLTCTCGEAPRTIWAPQDAPPLPVAQLCAALRVLMDDLPTERLSNDNGSLREALVDVLTFLAHHPEEA
jgi:hypothetical protein